MKQKMRKVLALLLALVMVCGLMSTAWADDNDDGSNDPPIDETPGDGDDDEGDGEDPPSVTHDVDTSKWEADKDGHWHVCSSATCDQKGKHDYAAHTTPTSYTYTKTSNTEHTRNACNICDYTITEEHSYPNGVCVCGAEEPAPTVTLTRSPSASKVSLDLYDSRASLYYATFSVTPSGNTGSLTYEWYLGSSKQPISRTATCTVDSSQVSSSATLTCYAYATGSSSPVATAEWTVTNSYTSQFSVSATVYDSNSGYYLTEVPDEGNSSVVDQINSSLTRLAGSTVSIDTVTFTSGNFSSSSRYDGYLTAKSGTQYSESQLSNISFIPTASLSSSTATATASYDFTLTTVTARGVKGNTYYGTLTFTIKQGTTSGSDIVYAAQIGENLTLDSRRFEDFWAESYPSGSLSYVEFTSISGGSLYANYSGSRGTNVVSSSSPTACYVNPSSRQTGLDDLTLVPSSSSRATTVTVRFTARGSSRSSSSAASTSKSGTLTVLYMNSSAKITYNTGTNGTVSLNPDDFTAAYKTAVGSTAPSGMTIRFTSLPANGTLSYQTSSTRSTTLTAANMGNYDFTTRTTGSTRISDVTYTASSKSTSETAEFVCYSGGTARFAGTITFNSKPTVVQNLSVSFTCTSTGDTAINPMSFYNSSTAVSSSSYIVFGAPTSGSLYLNGSALNSGAKLSFVTGTSYPLFSNVTYRPAANTANGTVTFSFTAYNSNDQIVASGTASIAVNLPATTPPTTPTTPTNPVLPSNPNPVQLTDVPAGSWYATYVNALVGAGIIGGYNDNTFRPQNDVTYGETLALIMRAVGYNIQQGSGSNWAMPYLTQAAADGLLPSNKAYGLGDSVDRYAIAEITAKAMGLTPVAGATSSPFSDTKDPYVLALHDAGIIGGTGSGYEGDKTFSRAEVAAVVYRIYLYNASNQTQTPDQTTQPDNDSSREPDLDAPWGY